MSAVPLSSIVFDAGTQARAGVHEDVVDDYAEKMSAGVRFPDVVLFHDGSQYYMADGFHRGLAAKRIGLTTINAVVHPGTAADALWFAIGANREHGARMTTADKRHAIELALQRWPSKSAREIAAQIGTHHSWVSDIRRQVSGPRHLTTKVDGRDGKSYPATRATNAAPGFTPSQQSPAFPDPTSRGPAVEEIPDKEESELVSSHLAELKRHWKRASRIDRRLFLQWVSPKSLTQPNQEKP